MAGGLIPTVGLEIHVRLATGRKLFCACAYHFGAPPNSQVCPVCLGLPGSLPVPDPEAVALALRAGAALQARLNPFSEFARKHYFYPDLPRNFQITQYEHPLFEGGLLDATAAGGQLVHLQRLHLEEDAGRSLTQGENRTLVDANRAGTPLLEIVTRPELRDGSQTRAWLQVLLATLQYCGVCEGNMARGDLRCDANVGLQGVATGPLTELKNLNSFRHVAQAVDFEIQRLEELVHSGQAVPVTTRSWDPAEQRTRFLRHKEAGRDYRYFPEPDIPPLRVPAGRLAEAAKSLPELPLPRRLRLQRQWQLSADEARALCRTRSQADYWEEVAAGLKDRQVAEAGRMAAHWVLGPLSGYGSGEEHTGGKATAEAPVWPPPSFLVDILAMLAGGEITARVAQRILERRLGGEDERDPATMVRAEGWGQIWDNDYLDGICRRVLGENGEVVSEYRSGRTQVLEFLVGQAMRLSGGRAPAAELRRLLGDKLGDSGGN